MATTLTAILLSARNHVAGCLGLDTSCVAVALDDEPPNPAPSDLFVTISPGPSSDLPEVDTFGGDEDGDDDETQDPVILAFDVRVTLFVRDDRDPAGRNDTLLTSGFPTLDRLLWIMQSWKPQHAGDGLLYRKSQLRRLEPHGRGRGGESPLVRFTIVAPVQFELVASEGVPI